MGHRTSVSVEEAFWEALSDIARAHRVSVYRLFGEIVHGRRGILSSAIRVYVLEALKSQS